MKNKHLRVKKTLIEKEVIPESQKKQTTFAGLSQEAVQKLILRQGPILTPPFALQEPLENNSIQQLENYYAFLNNQYQERIVKLSTLSIVLQEFEHKEINQLTSTMMRLKAVMDQKRAAQVDANNMDWVEKQITYITRVYDERTSNPSSPTLKTAEIAKNAGLMCYRG